MDERSSSPDDGSRTQPWRSLEEREALAQGRPDPNEFAPGASAPPAGMERRHFLGLLGASAALATAVACDRKARREVVPYTRRPEGGIPGVAEYYASAYAEGRHVHSVLVKTREGRPIHISGNDEHPRVRGGASPRTIAQVLSLYDPDRLRGPRIEGRDASWDEALDRVSKALAAAKAGGKGVLLVTGASASPTRNALIQDFKKAVPTLQHLAWEAAPDATEEASRALFGGSYAPVAELDRADLIVSFGADFMAGDPAAIAAFAKGRYERGEHGNRLWVLEGALSLTGSRADQRIPVAPSHLALLAFALAQALAKKGFSLPAGIALPALKAEGVSDAAWQALVSDLAKAGRKAAVLCGPELPAEAHEAVALLNAMLGSEAVAYQPMVPLATPEDVKKAQKDLEEGRTGTVILWGVNPAYAASGAFKAALAKAGERILIGQHATETAALCSVVLAEHHWLESWGDFAEPGLLTLQQPTIGALYDTKQGEDILLLLAKAQGASLPGDYHTYLKARWEREVQPKGSPVTFERFFQAALHDGVLPVASGASRPALNGQLFSDAAQRAVAPKASGLELVLHPSRTVYDGRDGNNGWLQELPDPVTKGTWGNPLAVSYAEARSLDLKDGHRVTLTVEGQSLTLPVVVQPGQAAGVLSLALGYGRETGSVAKGVGVNAYALLKEGSGLRSGVILAKASGSEDLPVTQGHHRMEGRDLVRALNLAQAARLPHEKHPHEHPTLYAQQTKGEHLWGMVIDLASCVGCSSCVVACQSENNTPVVGPEQVAKGREMHWIRVDRYYEGEPENPKVVHQPMMCQQCDHAPCENVCPVNATTHSPDGLNQMTYNRCVGTRYCANNCPYKVRRFNFLEYTATKTEPESLVYNPEVTVRPRGVMEKCTFCVQRIQDGRMRAKGENRPLKDGEIQPACAVSCPSQAIVFGDLKDPQSRVSQLAASGRGYRVLEELGVRPAVTYLADVRNPALEGDGHAS
jgi:MoCo/4Fe-4S cofactor protein with predicted Tat translocation signal